MLHKSIFSLSCIALMLATTMVKSHAQSVPRAPIWQAGVVLDAGITSRGLEMGARDKGPGLGHSDLLMRGAFNEHLSGEAILGFHTEDKKLERQHARITALETESPEKAAKVKALMAAKDEKKAAAAAAKKQKAINTKNRTGKKKKK